MPLLVSLARRARLALACTPLVAATAALAAGTPLPDVSMLAGACSNCHRAGPATSSPASIPTLQGFSEEQLRQRLAAFRAGQVPDATVMPRLMRALGDDEIAALARWFAQGPAR
ncbi:c-type cytochrome [Rubrivivax gelatinosus]|uniref:Cytochrome c553 n=1 Tax=Rubrivivax gelatinosus TaxID=28068 RepID=A0A4R2MEE7_RUBGE|nr:c-type cytochrome [Rubrivivax gelatinosus]MBK1690231.1 hypothetical protein [Rubrivivax gelatinosus]TCP03585.1 cytochrome c553 [Rubrivivax gelatinosus]